MRKWMRERMKRRKKSSENLSESTGKIGQALDPTKPAPIVPSYGRAEESDEVEPSAGEPAPQGRIEVETQPDSPFTPPAAPDAATRKPGQPQQGAKKEPRGVVVLTIGLPGSGKTTWYKRRGVTPLSSDMLRTILFDSITEQRYQGLVFSTLRSLLRARLIAKMPWNYVDATNLSPHERRQWIKMARGFGYEVHAVFFDVPLELCLERNRRRERQVPEDVMKQMAQRLKPPTFKEGFSKIVVVRVKQGEAASGE
jgi:predicted kinase